MLIYDLTLDAHFGGVQEAFTLARSLAGLTRHKIIVHGNTITVEVDPRMSDEDCHRAYDAAIQAPYQDEALAPEGNVHR